MGIFMNDSAIKQCSAKQFLSLRSCLVGVVLGAATLMSADMAFAQSDAQQPTPAATEVAPAQEAAPSNVQVPEEVSQTLAEMDEAATQQQLNRLLRFYSPEFTHSDGLTRQSLKSVIKAFWDEHQELTYKTEVLAWEADPKGGGTATTKTTINGSRTVEDQEMKLTATVQSRQRWLDQKMVEQTITAEQSQLTSGENPPEITVNIPEQVKVGGTFNFDVVVDKPLDDRLLLGTAVEEVISPERYLEQPSLKLELLPAGGLFKVGQAPKKPTSEWISAVLVQDGGMVVISRRLTVVRQTTDTKQSLLTP
jgi:hypothetical protein